MQWTGIEDFDMQLRAFLNTLIGEISDASTVAMEESKESLKDHIVNDVYKAYTPKAYKRRSENPLLGTPLSDLDAYSHTIKPSGGNVGGNLVVTTKLYYNPRGSHAVARWSSDAPQKKKIKNVDDNELIGRIEKKDPAYNWGNSKVPERPFWQEFVREMVDGGRLEKAFVRAMKPKEQVVADGNIVAETYDTEY